MKRSGARLRQLCLVLSGGVLAVVVAACGSSGSSSSVTSSKTAASATGAPAGSSGAKGELLIYSNSGTAFIQPVLNAFAKAYPQVKVRYNDVEDSVSFSRYRAEHAQGARTADVIIASSPSLWVQNKDIASNWAPIDTSAYPSWRTQFPGVFILSPDPTVSIYSKVKLPASRVPDTFAQLVTDAKQSPGVYDKKMVTYTANNFFGYSAFWGHVKNYGWSDFNTLGPQTKPAPDGTAMAQQIATGASNYGYFESGLIRGALTPVQQKLIGWLYMRDFTPLVPRGIAVTNGAGNPTAAKAFVNWLYGVSGQASLCAAGFTAFRTGVNCPFSLSAVTQAVGASHVYLVPYHSTIAQDRAAFVQHWHRLFG
jgi:iron(III) transport system substrate-binding protein